LYCFQSIFATAISGRLPLLGSTDKQDDQRLPIHAAIHAIAGAEVQPQFHDTRPDALRG